MNFLSSPANEMIAGILFAGIILALGLWTRTLEERLRHAAAEHTQMLDDQTTRWRLWEQSMDLQFAQQLENHVQQAAQRLLDCVQRKEVDDIVNRSRRQNAQIEKRLHLQHTEIARIVKMVDQASIAARDDSGDSREK